MHCKHSAAVFVLRTAGWPAQLACMLPSKSMEHNLPPTLSLHPGRANLEFGSPGVISTQTWWKITLVLATSAILFRTSVKHRWYCAALRPSGMVEALCIEVTSQHAPVLCHTIGQILREFKLSWQRPRVFSSSWTSWTSSLDEAFCAAISQGVFGSSVRLASVERNRLSDKPTARFCLGIA